MSPGDIECWSVRRCPTCGHLAIAGQCYGSVDEPHEVAIGEPLEVVPAEHYVQWRSRALTAEATRTDLREWLRGALGALRYLANGLESRDDGSVRVIPGAIKRKGLREARSHFGESP